MSSGSIARPSPRSTSAAADGEIQQPSCAMPSAVT
jgi:hypothetical protein